jgi:putative hemolysin
MDPARAGILLVIILATCLAGMPAAAMVNPSAGYCLALGYEYTDITGPDGSMTGYCVLPGNQSVDAWQFLEGSISPEMGYCRTQGLEVRTVKDPAVCGMLGSTCAVCVRTDGTIQEVTRMMGLDFREKICNETICCDPATDTVCPIGQEHGSAGQSGSAEPASPALVAVIAVILVFIAAGSGYVLVRKKDGSETGKNP